MPVLHKLHKTRWMHDLRSVVEIKVKPTHEPAVRLHCRTAATDQLSDLKSVASCLDNRLIKHLYSEYFLVSLLLR